jgi:pimeloyl-ACP methyl ester carboxylesterase
MTRSNPKNPKTGRRATTIGVAAAAALALAVGIPAAANAAPHSAVHTASATTKSSAVKPTIVLVHGAFADASSFAPVTTRLQKDGYTVVNAPNPLRGLATDTADVIAFVKATITGPVVLVGHSYGGSVITGAADQLSQVEGLVYIDAFAPVDGESANSLSGAQPGSALAVKDTSNVFDFVSYPSAADGDVDAYVQQAYFAKTFAALLPKAQAKELAASQSPIAASALNDEFSGTPAWKTIKSYFFIGTADQILPAAEQRIMAKRAGGVVVTGHTDHLAMLEAPAKVTSLIEKAAR